MYLNLYVPRYTLEFSVFFVNCFKKRKRKKERKEETRLHFHFWNFWNYDTHIHLIKHCVLLRGTNKLNNSLSVLLKGTYACMNFDGIVDIHTMPSTFTFITEVTIVYFFFFFEELFIYFYNRSNYSLLVIQKNVFLELIYPCNFSLSIIISIIFICHQSDGLRDIY